MNAFALLAPAFAAGLLALISHVPLGRQVLRRGIVFIDLAIAQVAGLGVALASSLLPHPEPSALAVTAALAALAGAGAVALLGRLWPERQEALIGVLYISAASLAVMVMSADPHGAQKLASMLSGDVLWVTWPALLPLAVATAAFVLVQWRWPALLTRAALFYPAFALLISLSLPLLGLYLVFATLIVPALAALRAPDQGAAPRPRTAYAVGAGGYALGLAASWHWDWPSGPAVVLALVLVAVVTLLLSPRGATPAAG